MLIDIAFWLNGWSGPAAPGSTGLGSFSSQPGNALMRPGGFEPGALGAAVAQVVAGIHTLSVMPLHIHTVSVTPRYTHTVTVAVASP